MPIEDVLRLINIGLIVVWFYFMCYLYQWWASRPKEERMILTTIPLLLLLILFSTGESLAQDVGFGSRLLIFTPVLILCIFSSVKLALKVRHINRSRKED